MTSVHCRPEGYSSNILQYCDSQFVRESMDKREHSYIVGGNVNWYNHYGKWCGASFKKNYKYSCHMIQQSHSQAFIWKRQKLKFEKILIYIMFIAALFTTPKIWKLSKCLPTDEWIKKLLFSHQVVPDSSWPRGLYHGQVSLLICE